MSPRRLLVVTYGRADRTRGGAQMALNLAAALAERGHEAISFATGQAPAELPFWRHLSWHQRQLETFLETALPCDALDLPAVALSKRVSRFAPAVARSIQPDLRYFLAELPGLGRRLRRQPIRATAVLAYQTVLQAIILRRMARARILLCLGSEERQWCERRLPWLRGRLAGYDNALASDESAELVKVRAARGRPEAGPGLSYLWLGRWAEHKGVRPLRRFLLDRLRTHPEERFTLAGCGPLSPDELPDELARHPRLSLVPTFSREELPALLAAHHAGLFTSTVEGWGLSLNEMLEAGLTVFASQAGGVRDLQPFFPRQLRPFPPPAQPSLAWPLDDLEASGYARRFRWSAIAERYEAEVLETIAARTNL